MPESSRVFLLVAIAFVLPACTDGGSDIRQSPAPEEDATNRSGSDNADQIQWTACEHPEGIDVQYPQDWSVNEESPTLPSCSAFNPQPLDMADPQDLIDSAVLLSVDSIDFATAIERGALAGNVLDRNETSVDGHEAVRVESESADDPLLEEGIRSTRWLIAFGPDETVSLVSNEAVDSEDYESNREILDEMAVRLQLLDN